MKADANKFLHRLRALGYSARLSDSGGASAYVILDGEFKFRFSNHGQAHVGVAMSCDPETGHTVIDALRETERLLNDARYADARRRELKGETAEARRAWETHAEELRRANGGEAGIREQIAAIDARMSRRAHEGGPRGNVRKQLSAERTRLRDLLNG